MNPNGLEIAAAIALTAGALRVGRDPTRSPCWVWAAVAVSGAVTVLSWQLGPAYAGMNVLLFAGIVGRAGIRGLYTGRRGGPAAVVLAGLAAFGAYVVYGASAGVLHSTLSIGPLLPGLRVGFHNLRHALGEAVGVFGAESIPLAPVAVWTWSCVVLAIVGAALWFADRRERTLIAGVTLGAVTFPVLFYAWIYRYTGFSLRGRYVLPVFALVPLVAGEILYRHRAVDVTRRPWLAVAGIVAIAAVQLFAWQTAASHAAGNPDAVWFLNRAAWAPPLGWWPWAVLAMLGTLALLSFATRQLVARAASVPRR